MPKILLINPGQEGPNKHTSHRRIHRDPPPLSILYVGTYFKQIGYDVELWDAHIEPDKHMYLIENLVGISIIIGPHMKNAAILARKTWYAHDTTCLIGGVMPTIYPIEMVCYIGDFSTVVLPGKFVQNVDAPDWTLLGDKITHNQMPYYHMIMTSTGCAYDCSFCYNKICGNKVEYRSVDSIKAEIDQLIDICNTKVVTFGDDSFLTKKSRAIEILNYCKSKGIYVEECIGHINQLDADLIDAMGGTVQTFIFSIESADYEMQKLLRKHIRLEEVPEKVRLLKSAGIACNVSFMVGLPQETEKHLEKNLYFMAKLRGIHPYARGNCYFWFPLPKTDLTYHAEKVYDMPLHWPVAEYEDANFWVHSPADPIGRKFRPYLSQKRFTALTFWAHAFNNRFSLKNPPYVLDRVLAGETINLKEDMR